ncbi:retrovirus-related Pol polyprotein from transposon 412 [Trichonephila clavipes]|uniref:Retrovirus-related Pol polyprotein from transposon 412 n=1 Tax=Trichonephila clavipes TaxID=2585209 RepID=A0A8X7BDP8_TRICX|nr:retrovirus-related Pol polyprotein from transposon 412 [Trichonephila clavipes]
MTTVLHPQSDGMVERFKRTILNSLSLLVSSNQQDWDKKLPFFLLAYRSAVHETTGYSPSQMLFGRDLRLPADLLFSRPPDAPLAPEEYIEKLQARMEEMHHLASERIVMASEKMKTGYDARATGHDFHEGDKVWLWNPKRRKGLSPKLQTNWEGPYTVLKRLNDVVVRIQKSHTQNRRSFCRAYKEDARRYGGENNGKKSNLTRTIEVDWSPLLTVARKRSPSIELDASSLRPNSIYQAHLPHLLHSHLATALFSAIWVDR